MKILNLPKKSVKLILVLVFFLFGFVFSSLTAKAANGMNFFIDSSYDIRGRNNIMATSRVIGINAFYFVDDFFWDSKNSQEQSAIIENITILSNEFDNIIYPKMRQLYGEEWSPGIDGDKKIYILLTDIKNNVASGSFGGYFSTINEYSKALLDEYKRNQLESLEREKKADIAAGKNIDSYWQKENKINSIFTNEKELLYLNINFINEPELKSFFAHEFQHMINWNEKTRIYNINEEIWLNEALSEYAPTALGYDNIYKNSNLESSVINFNRNPSDSLIEWKNTDYDYSTVNIFMQFLIGRYGTGILKSITTSPKIGTEAISDALKRNDYQASFSNVFSDWMIANYYNGRIIQDKKYGYANPNLSYENLHISATSSFMLYSNGIAKNSVIKNDNNIKNWSGNWYQFLSSQILSEPNQVLNIDFSVDATGVNFQMPYAIENIDGSLIINNFIFQGNQNGDISIGNFGTAVKSVIIMPFGEKNISTSEFEKEEIPVKFTYIASLISPNQLAIKSVFPKTSALRDKTMVTIIGENFMKGLSVKFGGVLAAEINFINSETIIVQAPFFEKKGEVDIVVINPDSTIATASGSFTYLSDLKDGSLIRLEGDYKVYVVTGKYKRWIQTEKIFDFYNFHWSDIVTVTPEIIGFYATSTLVRADNDYKVYEIGIDNKKHHLSMSGLKFEASGRKWEAIFIINNAEKNYYKTGVVIAR